MDLVSMTVAPLAKAILSQVGKEIGGVATKHARALMLGDPEQKALERALGRAFAEVRKSYGRRLADFDINAGFWEHEGAAELSKVLVAGLKPSAARLAERAVDSLGPSGSDDERLDRIFSVRPVFTAVLTELAREVRAEPALHRLLERADTARTADAASAIAATMGAGTSSEDDRVRYLSWLIDQHRYLRTAGVVRNTAVRLPLEEVFVGLRARRDRHPGDRARTWFEQERQKAAARLEAGQLDQLGYEVALDRLQAQYGRKFAIDGVGASDEPVQVLDAVRDASQVLVLGDPGSGKTTLLRYLALCHARRLLKNESVQGQAARFPIYVRIAEYSRLGHPRMGISDFLLESLNRSECRIPGLASMLGQQLEAGRCLILLDGLDEVASAELRREVVAAVVNFVAAHSRSGNRFVVTSRVAGYQAAPLPQLFTAMQLHDMDDDTINRFLQVYCQQVERAEAPKNSQTAIIEAGAREATAIEQALRSNAGVRRLAANPLLLTALVLVHRASGRLPHRRVEAYVEVSTALGRTWRSAQGVADADLPDERILTRWLTELGAWMHQYRSEGAATRAELLRVLGPLWAAHQGSTWDPDVLLTADPLDSDAGRGVLEFVEKADTHTGLLVERAPGRYGFAHLTFEEYYAGRALAFRGTATQRVTTMRRLLHDPRYEEPILLALGLIGTDYADQIDDVVTHAIYPGVAPSPYEDLLGRDFLFMLRVLADDTPVLTVTIDNIITLAINELLDAEHSRCRFTNYRRALEQQLAALTGTKAADRYLTAVDKRATQIASETVQPWIKLAVIAAQLSALLPATIAALIDIATSDTDPSVRVQAGSALAGGGVLGESAITALTDIATSDTDLHVRVQAVSALAGGGVLGESAITTLTHIATSDTDPYVRVEAAWALAGGGVLGESAITTLTHIATSDTDPSVGVQAVEALAQGEVLGESAITALTHIATSSDTDLHVRVQAVSALAGGGVLGESAITTLTDIATSSDTDLHVRVEAVSALARRGALDESAITALTHIATSSDTDLHVRVRAVSALARRGALDESAITTLTHIATSDTDPYLRVQAVDALAGGGVLGESAITALTHIATSSDTDPSVRVQAGSALAGGGVLGESAITALTHIATSDTDPSVGVQAVEALAQGEVLGESAITALTHIATSSDTDPYLRVQAVDALAGGGVLGESAITTLTHIATSSDTDPSVRVQAVSALARRGALDESAITTLTHIATSDTDPPVGVQAVEALAQGEVLGESAITALTHIATNAPAFTVRERAVIALQAAPPTPKLRKALVKLFRDDDNDVRRTTAATLVEWSRRHPQYAVEIRSDLANACTDPTLEARDKIEFRTGWDYAHEGLRAHVEAIIHSMIDA